MRRLEKLSKRPRTSGLLAGCLAAVALLATASAACALTYRPTRTDDPKPNGCKAKDCSLREAVIAGLKDLASITGGSAGVIGVDDHGVIGLQLSPTMPIASIVRRLEIACADSMGEVIA